MGVLGRIFGRKPATKDVARMPTDRIYRHGDNYFYSYGASRARTPAGAAVYACVSRIASRVAEARFRVVGKDGEEIDHLLNELLRSPSGQENKYTVQQFMAVSLLTEGNAYLLKQGRGPYPTALQIVEPHNVGITVGKGRGYSYTLTLPQKGVGTTKPLTVSNLAVVHAKGLYYDPELGKSASPLKVAAASVDLYIGGLKSSVSYLHHASRYGAFIKSSITADEYRENKEAIAEQAKELFAGPDDAGKTIILPHGMEYQPGPSLGKEMLLADVIDCAVAEIARLYGVPLALIQHTAGQRPNLEELSDGLMRDGVMPVCAQISAALSERLLTVEDRIAGHRIEADLSQFAKPTASGQAERLKKLGDLKILTRDELRKEAGFGPAASGGDEIPDVTGSAVAGDAVKSGSDE